MRFSAWSLPLCAAGALLCSPVSAADRANLSDAQKRYQEERALCMSGQSGQERTTCLREAGAALQEARRGRLEVPNAQFEQNALARCAYLRADERTDCERRMKGEGSVSGSVAGGGLYRELRTIVPAPETADSTPEGEASTGVSR